MSATQEITEKRADAQEDNLSLPSDVEGLIILLTGVPAVGKSGVANALFELLSANGKRVSFTNDYAIFCAYAEEHRGDETRVFWGIGENGKPFFSLKQKAYREVSTRVSEEAARFFKTQLAENPDGRNILIIEGARGALLDKNPEGLSQIDHYDEHFLLPIMDILAELPFVKYMNFEVVVEVITLAIERIQHRLIEDPNAAPLEVLLKYLNEPYNTPLLSSVDELNDLPPAYREKLLVNEKVDNTSTAVEDRKQLAEYIFERVISRMQLRVTKKNNQS